MAQKKRIIKVWVDTEGIYATTEDNITAGYKFSQWVRLAEASQKDREQFYLTYGGVHWPTLDEDLIFEGMFENGGYCQRTPTEDSVYWDSQLLINNCL